MKQRLPHAARRLLLGAALAALLSACTSPPSPDAPTPSQSWSGRMALQVAANGSTDGTAHAISASFHLQGSPAQGSLDVFTPLGSQVAALTWGAGWAQLQQGQQLRRSESLTDLVRSSLGTDVPIEALFAWLQGHNVQAAGWQVDVSQHARGRISAQRLHPQPPAQLKIILQP